MDKIEIKTNFNTLNFFNGNKPLKVVKNQNLIQDENENHFSAISSHMSPLSMVVTKINDSYENETSASFSESCNPFLKHKNEVSMLGGAIQNKKKPMRKEEVKPQEIVMKRNAIEITTIGKMILKQILEIYPNVIVNNSFNDKLIPTIQEIVRMKNIDMNNREFELLIRFVQDNFVKSIGEMLLVKHPMLIAMEDADFKKKLFEITNYSTCNRKINYGTRIVISRDEWRGIKDVFAFNKTVSLDSSKSMVHPLFFILYANKLPGFEDLTIHQDYPTLIEDFSMNKFNKNNAMLMALRMNDPNLLPVVNSNYRYPLTNESLRVNIAILLREISIRIRSGQFISELSDTLFDLLCEVKMPNVKSEEENLLNAIFATVSYKPTLLVKQEINPLLGNIDMLIQPNNGLNMFKNDWSGDNITSTYTIEYPLTDINSYNRGPKPVFSDSDFKYLGINTITKKVVFLKKDNLQTNNLSQNEMFANILNNLNQRQVDIDYKDIFSTIITRSGESSMFKNITPVKVLLSNGMFVMSIPRIDKTYSSCYNQNSFFKYNAYNKEILNLTPLICQETINMNSINYNLVGALCYDTIENQDSDNYANLRNNYYYDLNNKVGTYALVKTEDGWFNYNPNLFLTMKRENEVIDEILNRRYRFYFQNSDERLNLPDEEGIYTSIEWKQTPMAQEIIHNLQKRRFGYVDLLITPEEALELISTNACLLFYAEDYDTYRNRSEQTIF